MKGIYICMLLLWLMVSLLFCLQIPSAKATSFKAKPSPAATVSEQIPIITEVTLNSNNLCNPGYAIAGDRITCTFTTIRPCNLTFSPDNTTIKPPPAANSAPETSPLLTNPFGNQTHWICTFTIPEGMIPDQSIITGKDILNKLFPGGYLYYGENPSIIYYAPLRIDYQCVPVFPQSHFLHIKSNHPVELLPPDYYRDERGYFCCISLIDVAGNGPLGITIPLEAGDILLYNLNDTENVPLTGTDTFISFESSE